MWVPRGRECVFNVHHPSVWQIEVASAEVHLATHHALMFPFSFSLQTHKVSALKFAYLYNNIVTNHRRLSSLYIVIGRVFFAWTDLHTRHTSVATGLSTCPSSTGGLLLVLVDLLSHSLIIMISQVKFAVSSKERYVRFSGIQHWAYYASHH